VLAWLKSLPKQRAFWSDTPCVGCGFKLRRTFPTIWDGLSNEWGLTTELRRQMDLRESTLCARCRTNARAQGIGRALLNDLAKRHAIKAETVRALAAMDLPRDLRIAEINALPGLHKHFAKMPNAVCSEYGGDNHEDLMALSYPDETFDYVLTSDSLEHVPDFDVALNEIRRVLKPEGQHIFTIPVIWDRKTRIRASVVEGKRVDHLPPSHHGNPKTAAGDWIVFNEFGGDVVKRIESAGFSVEVCRTGNPLDATIVAERL
jgi:SAM-dependent methyltransferase